MGLIGNTVKQPGGFSAFVPSKFPPESLPNLTPQAMALLEKATILLGRLDGITELLPDVDFFIFSYINKEATLSSQLEGTQATMVDALKAQSSILSGLPDDVDDIIHYINALNHGLHRLTELPLSMRLLYEAHEVLMTGARASSQLTPGEIRTTQNWIGGGSPATARFVPPPPHLVRESLSDLERFLHDDEAASVILKAGLAHAQFETIHPFPDGNGRTGRLLITFYLCSAGILTRPVLYLSDYFNRNKDAYCDKLDAYHRKDEIHEWLMFFFEGVAEVAESAINACKQITRLRERDVSKISSFGRGAPSALLALQTLYRYPIVTVRTIEQQVGISRTNANKLVTRLVENQILYPSDETAEYGRTFVYTDYLRIFNSP